MTVEGRPVTKRTTRITREARYTINVSEHEPIIREWLRKTFPEFRGFSDDEIDVDFIEGGSVTCYALKEEAKDR